MKWIYKIVCFSLFLMMVACGSEPAATAEANNTATSEVPEEAPIEIANSAEQHQGVGKENKKAEEPVSNVKAAPINYNTLADAYCKCAAHTVSVNEKLKKLMDNNDTAAFDAMLPEAEKAFKDAMECCRNAKFQQTTAEVEQKKLFPPLKKACPDLPQQLMLKMVTEIK
jgi:hypothetical protein